ncbi:cupin domain-containing protein [Streptantibioticus rubrisoli]|uniref:Cupin domain-containing protein n=1 Tax=Streptantibioticus rubrisoli TaxID=1387313 RepID=A0ABT1PBM3_9ACTN|nr:cupin domain-containing protein [Streptantibioticus rubrisoli]MCQ4042776.1 cupin domain-containing protein [Streptantibioticus rubrisoli]
MSHPLAALISSGRITLGDTTDQAAVFRACCEPDAFLTEADIGEKLEVSLLRWPYLVLESAGRPVPIASYTQRRQCVGATLDGFVDPEAVRALQAKGVDLELRHLADWHRPTRELEAELEAMVPFAVTARAVLRAPWQQGTQGVEQSAGSLVVQLGGRLRWQADAPVPDVSSDSVQNPGDLLYLPAGRRARHRALDESSLHLALDFITPTVADLVAVVRRHVVQNNPDLILRHHLIAAERRSVEVRDRLRAAVAELSEGRWLAQALALARRRAHRRPPTPPIRWRQP